MRGDVKVFRGMSIWRGVAAPDVSAGEAEPQMHPRRTDLQTVFTPLGAGNNVVSYLVKVRAVFAHDLLTIHSALASGTGLVA